MLPVLSHVPLSILSLLSFIHPSIYPSIHSSIIILSRSMISLTLSINLIHCVSPSVCRLSPLSVCLVLSVLSACLVLSCLVLSRLVSSCLPVLSARLSCLPVLSCLVLSACLSCLFLLFVSGLRGLPFLYPPYPSIASHSSSLLHLVPR